MTVIQGKNARFSSMHSTLLMLFSCRPRWKLQFPLIPPTFNSFWPSIQVFIFPYLTWKPAKHHENDSNLSKKRPKNARFPAILFHPAHVIFMSATLKIVLFTRATIIQQPFWFSGTWKRAKHHQIDSNLAPKTAEKRPKNARFSSTFSTFWMQFSCRPCWKLHFSLIPLHFNSFWWSISFLSAHALCFASSLSPALCLGASVTQKSPSWPEGAVIGWEQAASPAHQSSAMPEVYKPECQRQSQTFINARSLML